MPATTSSEAPVEVHKSPIKPVSFDRPEQVGYNHIMLPKHPENIVRLIDTMDLSKSVFLGQEHGVVTRQTNRKIL